MGSRPKNLQKAKNKKFVYVFFVTFFVSMLFVGLVIKAFTPNVDVEIGDGVEYSEEYVKATKTKEIDSRLKWIQFEDNMPGVSNRFSLNSKDKDSKEDKIFETQDDEKGLEEETVFLNKASKEEKPRHPIQEAASNLAPRMPAAPIKMSKVYIGYYATVEQAIKSQNKLIDSDLGVSPFVKELNGYYVVQVGSYASKQKAQLLAREVMKRGFPAKVITD